MVWIAEIDNVFQFWISQSDMLWQKRLLSVVYVLQVRDLNESCSSVCLNEALVVVLSR